MGPLSAVSRPTVGTGIAQWFVERSPDDARV
jgi:hypothetical protein